MKYLLILFMNITILLSPSRTESNTVTHMEWENRDNVFISDWRVKNKEYKQEFLQELLPDRRMQLILNGCREYGIKPSTVLSQVIIESKANGRLAVADHVKETNNYFGIKAVRHPLVTGSHQMASTEEVNGIRVVRYSKFAKYASFKDCFDHYLEIVSKYEYTNWNEWERKMTKRYATSSQYKALIDDVAKSNYFRTFDVRLKNE